MKQMLILLVILLSSFGAQAVEMKMAIITSEIDKNVTDFYIETNSQNEIESMRYVTILPNGGIMEDVTVPAETVMREGAVIVERSGYQVVRLEVEKFSVKTGGIIKMNYLFNAVSGSRSVKRIKLENHEGFHLYDLENKKINRMYVLGNWSRVLGNIGVRDIETSYKD